MDRDLSDAELQALLADVVREYAARALSRPDGALPAFAPGDRVEATEALVAAGAICKAAEISAFELATLMNV